jgi:pimeloyl-ACP methyl ester carboxylesterase
LHGILSTAVCWRPVQRELAGRLETVAADLPGCGRARSQCGRYALEEVVEALSRVIEAEAPTHVVGHSMGAILALALGAAFPDQIERVGVIGLPVFRNREDGLGWLGKSRGRTIRAFLRHDALSHAGCQLIHRLGPAWAPPLRRLLGHDRVAGQLALFDHSTAAHTGGFENIVFGGRVEELAERGERVVAMHGGSDRSAPAGRARSLAARRGWPFELVPGAGHMVIVDRPRHVARWIEDTVAARGETAGGALTGELASSGR